jgi:hypothetical protein
MPRFWLIPLVVASALFMENMDATVIATSLPAIAADLGKTRWCSSWRSPPIC